MTPDLLAVVHPWTSAPGHVDVPATTDEREYELGVTSCFLSLNARVLRELDGVAVVVSPVGFVVVIMNPSDVTGDVLSLHLRTMPKSERFSPNMLWTSVPSSAARAGTSPVSTLFVNDFEDGLGNPFELRRQRKGVPYRLGGTGLERPFAAATVLPAGVWVCRVRLESCAQDAEVGTAQHADGAESSTATVILSRRGHRRAAQDRALMVVYETVSAAWNADGNAHQRRRGCLCNSR